MSITVVEAREAISCGCHETYPQLQAGRVNHAPGCPNVKASAPFLTWRYGVVMFLAARTLDGYSICDNAGRWYGAWQDVETFRSRQRNGGDWEPLMGRAAVTVKCL